MAEEEWRTTNQSHEPRLYVNRVVARSRYLYWANEGSMARSTRLKKGPRVAMGARARAPTAGEEDNCFCRDVVDRGSRWVAHLVRSLDDIIGAHRVLLAVLMP